MSKCGLIILCFIFFFLTSISVYRAELLVRHGRKVKLADKIFGIICIVVTIITILITANFREKIYFVRSEQNENVCYVWKEEVKMGEEYLTFYVGKYVQYGELIEIGYDSRVVTIIELPEGERAYVTTSVFPDKYGHRTFLYIPKDDLVEWE